MKFVDLEGNVYRKDIRPYKRDGRKRSASKGQKELGRRLVNLFPNMTIYEELPCFGTRMRLDFYIHDLKIAFEFDGDQHETYNPFFHGTKRNFIEQKYRDYNKAEWCTANSIRLVRVRPTDLDRLKELIHES